MATNLKLVKFEDRITELLAQIEAIRAITLRQNLRPRELAEAREMYKALKATMRQQARKWESGRLRAQLPDDGRIYYGAVFEALAHLKQPVNTANVRGLNADLAEASIDLSWAFKLPRPKKMATP